MKQFYKVYQIVILIALTMMLAACADRTGPYGEIDVVPKITTVNKSDDVRVELPANYSQKNYKRLIVAVYFEPNKKAMNTKGLPLASVATALETEMTKLKRFTIVSRQGGQNAIAAEEAFQALGRTDAGSRLRFDSGLNANYVLYCAVTGVREEYERYDYNEFIYVVRLDYQLIDAETGEIVEADYTEGRARRTCVRLPSGRIVAGFDTRSGELDAVNQAALNGLTLLGNRLGNQLPIGGQVVAMRGDRVKIDKGVAEGFMDKQVVTLYTEDFGMDVPFAVAEITPSDHSSIGKIFAWSDDDYTAELIEELQSDPNFIKRHNVYAVSQGMPLPAEWDTQYDD